MKKIEQYINEHILKGHLKKQQNINWKWRGKALSNEEYIECQNVIKKWAEKKYGEFTPETYLNIIKTYYIIFLKADHSVKKSAEDNNKDYNKLVSYAQRHLLAKGITWFNNNYMGQGWFDFMNYAITNNYI